MIKTKFLVILGIVICLFIIYYFYSEISSIKKLYSPTYQKTMALETKITELEKKTERLSVKKNSHDSPAMTLTYHSDMAKNANGSVKYTEVTDTEAKILLEQINRRNIKSKPVSNGLFVENTDTINVKLPIAATNQANYVGREEYDEYQQILNGLSKSNSIVRSEDVFEDGSDIGHVDSEFAETDNVKYIGSKANINDDDNYCFDEDIIKSISESLKYADMPSDTELSDLPTKKLSKPTTNRVIKPAIKSTKPVKKIIGKK